MIAMASFSTDGNRTSESCSVLEKKATGRPAGFKVAAMATSDASVSTSNGRSSSMAYTTDSSILFLRSLKAATASVDNGKNLLSLIGFILSENLGIHRE